MRIERNDFYLQFVVEESFPALSFANIYKSFSDEDVLLSTSKYSFEKNDYITIFIGTALQDNIISEEEFKDYIYLVDTAFDLLNQNGANKK